MRIRDMNWMQVERYLEDDDRCVVPLGSTEQHGYLSLMVDTILPERVATEAADPLGVPVFPALPYGVAPYFLGYPGTVAITLETYLRFVRDILDSLAGAGFRRIVLVNGHGGNSPVATLAVEWMDVHSDVTVKVHNWWNAPETWAKVQEVDPVASHASWLENFPWTRLEGVALPDGRKEPIERDVMAVKNPARVREYLGDGNFAGVYWKPDGVMMEVWAVAVAEVRAAIEGPWA
jgi:creatinine amidohydrolase